MYTVRRSVIALPLVRALSAYKNIWIYIYNMLSSYHIQNTHTHTHTHTHSHLISVIIIPAFTMMGIAVCEVIRVTP